MPAEPVIRVLRILVPSSELRPFKTRDSGAIVWLPSAAVGLVGTISIILTPPDLALELPDNLPSARIVGIVRAGFRSAWAIYADSTLDSAWARAIDDARTKLAELPRPALASSGLRAVVWD